MAIKPFNSVGGYSVGPNLEIVIDSDRSANLADVTVNGNLTLVGGNIQLGDVANVHIDGGANGQYLATDGSGNLTWVTLDTDTLANGTSNVSIDSANGNITFGVNGTANVVTVSEEGIDIGGSTSANLEFGAAANVFTTGADSIDIFTNGKTGAFSEVALNHGSNVLIVADGNGWSFNANGTTQFPGFTLDSATTPTTAQVLTFNGTTATWATVDTDTLANGTSNVSIDAINGPVTIGVGGTANVAVFATTGLDIIGGVTATGTVTADTLYANTLANVAALTVRGDANLQGQLQVAGAANIDSTLSVTGVITGLSDLELTGAANITGTLTVQDAANLNSTLGVTSTITGFADLSIATDGDFGGNLQVDGTANVAGNINGDTNLNLLGTANIVTDLLVGGLANITGAVELGSTLDVTGIATFDANVDVTGNLTFASANGTSIGLTGALTTVDLTATGQVDLGDVANLAIAGGSTGQYLAADGTGGLLWTTLDTDTLANGTSNVSIDVTDGPVTIGVNGTANVAVFTDMSATFSGSIYATNGQVNAYALYATTSANVDSLDVRGNAAIVGTANVTGDINGDSNLNLLGNANIVSDLLVGGNANVTGTANIVGAVELGSTLDVVGVATFDANVNVTGNLTFASASGANVDATYGITTANLTANANVTLGDVANVHIAGGTAGLVLTTDGAGNLSWTNSNIKYSREIHVDSTLGNDTTGDGSYNKPYATIMKAHSMITSGVTVFLHVGGYSETVTWTKTNCDIIGLSAGGMVNVTGAWTVGTTTPASIRIKDIAFNAAFTQNSTGRIIFQSCYLRNTFTKTSGEYTQFDDCDVAGTGISIASAGTVVFNGGSQNLISVSNAGAVVSINNSIATASITVTAGTVVTSDSYIYALTNTGNAVTSSAGSAVYLYNSHVIAPNQTIARVSLAGFWTANDTQYDKANSTLTGTNLGTVSYFDAINTQGVANVATLQVRGTSTLGAVGNVSISGGTTGQYLQTNGSGTLSWTTVELSNIHNGTSNVSIPSANGDVIVAANGQANIVTVSSNGTFATTTINDDVLITGNLKVQGNTVSVNVTELNVEDPIIATGRGSNNAVLTTTDGKDRGLFSYYFDTAEKGAFIGIMTTGAHAGEYVVATDAVVVDNVVTVNSYGNIVVGNVIGNLANGTTSVGIDGAGGDITLSVAGTANVVVATASGIDVTGAIKVRTVTSIDAATLTTTSTSMVALASVADAAGLAVEFLVKGVDSTGGKFMVTTVLAISDGAGTIDEVNYGTNQIGTSAGIVTVVKTGAQLELQVVPSSTNSTVWTVQYRTI